MGIEIEKIDTTVAPESLLRELARTHEVFDEEELPGDPPTPIEKRIADWRIAFKRFVFHRWILRDDGEIRAVAFAEYDVEENLEHGMGRIAVLPEHRGKGYARHLATAMFDHLEDMGRTKFETWIKSDTPTERLAEKVGLKSVLGERRSRLVISELDIQLMQSWVERAAERASDYELISMKAPFPEEHLEKYCDMMSIMNTAPLEDLDFDDEHLTPEDWRDIEASVLAAQNQINNLTAVHKPSGDFVGYTQIKTQALQPDQAFQWDTGVHADHRNKGLGRWLKAENILRTIEEYPRVDRIDTENAGSNEPMLNINVAMGFKPILDINVWQGDLATVRERLRA